MKQQRLFRSVFIGFLLVVSSTVFAKETTINACKLPELTEVLPFILSKDASGANDCLIRYQHKSFSKTDTKALENIIQTGVSAWRQQEFDNRACVQCHGPDMIEFAYLDFGVENFLRRSVRHVTPETTEKMLDAVFAMRKKYRIHPKDPFSYRVFQPGGFVLGDTQQSSHSRDYLFGQYLAQHGLSLASSRLSFNAKKPQNSIAAAKIMQQQLKQLDLAELPIGIPFPLWSSDRFHGATFNTLNAWIPRVEHGFALNPALIALHDNYLSHSSDVNLSLLLQGIDVYQNLPDDKFFSDGRGRNFIRAQYLSMQLGSHFMRMDVLRHAPAAIRVAEYTPAKMKTIDKLALNPFPFFNGPWDFAAHFRDNDLASNMVVEQQPFPIETISRFFDFNAEQANELTDTAQLTDEQLQQLVAESDNIILPWFWLGWILDRSLKFTNQDFPPPSAEYFAEHLWKRNQGYPIHNAFMVAKRNVEILTAPVSSLPVRNNAKQSEAMNTRTHYAQKWPYTHPDANTHTHIADYNTGMTGLDNAPIKARILTGAFPELTNFAENKQMYYQNYHIAGVSPNQIPSTQTQYLSLYQRITGNMYRMFLLLMLDALNQQQPLGFTRALHDKINKMEAFFKVASTEPNYQGSDNQALIQLLRAKLPSEGREGLIGMKQ